MLKALYLDLNSFFASCEQQLNPELRGRPVAVVPSMTTTTSVIAASYEAKAYGIKTGTRVGEAQEMCRDLTCIAADHGRYVHFHHKVKAVVDSVVPVHAVRSIDEFACVLSGRHCSIEHAFDLALEIKEQLSEQVGVAIKASIGLAPNFLLAKMAANMRKPDGLVILQPEDVYERLCELNLIDVPGIGPRMEQRLHQKGILTMEDLLLCSPQQARALWGSIYGAQMSRLLKGEWIDFRKESERKSIGHQHVLPPQKRNYQGALLVAHKLLWKAATRLRRHKLLAKRLHLRIKYRNGERIDYEARMSPTENSSVLLQKINQGYRQMALRAPPIKVSITLSDFVPEGQQQLSLFSGSPHPDVYKAVDKINERYGRDTIYAGTLHGQFKTAPTRIAFQRIPELDEVASAAEVFEPKTSFRY